MARIATRRSVVAAISLAGAFAAHPASAQTQAGSADATALVAEQIRQQGYACAQPASAAQDPAVDGDAVWTLTCADATYRVRLVPDQAAQVEKLQ
ncbi:MAG: hypothetical protein JNK47_22905 [Mesorhizobium sp.]|nr:hypothetical protein [Mesorhizobium sp.]MBL8580062.1 hypothetical protein [Mesorhizobium sp.]